MSLEFIFLFPLVKILMRTMLQSSISSKACLLISLLFLMLLKNTML